VVKSKSLPKSAKRISTYVELARHTRAFAQGHFSLLIVLGAPGLGKSHCLRTAMGDGAYWIDGNVSPFGLYGAAYEHRNRPLVLDDVDGLYADRTAVRLLKCLCQSDPIKFVSWHTKATAQGIIPSRFSTTSPVVIIANEWKSLNANVSALEDRGHILLFEPSTAEVHGHAATWFRDQEILAFVSNHLHLIERPSLRMYTQAAESKAAGLDWTEDILSRSLTGTALKVALLRADTSYRSEEDRVRAFVAAGLGCRATYFNYARLLRPSEFAASVPRDIPPSENLAALPACFTIFCGSGTEGANTLEF
jgi:hypothetical protein